MTKGVGKALYVFLCSIMGMVLFAIFHRAIIVIYYILLDYNFGSYAMGLTQSDVQMIDFFTGAVAVFLGGWYGVWLGQHWYGMVYEGEHTPGWLHGFLPRQWRKHERMARKAARTETASAPVEAPRAIHVPVKSHASGFEQFKSSKREVIDRSILPWNLDELKEEKPKAKRKRVTKAVTEKVVKPRKTAVRKRTVKAKVAEQVEEVV